MKYPRVTTILNLVDKGEGFMRWACSKGFDEAERIKREAANRGTHIHAIARSLVLGRTVSVSAEDIPYVDGIKKAISDLGLGPKTITEKSLVQTAHAYCGTCDLLSPDLSFVADWKTSKRIYKTYDLQLAAYAMAAMSMPALAKKARRQDGKPVPMTGLVIRLDGRGSYELRRLDAEAMAQAGKAFIGLLEAWRYFNEGTK